MGSNKKVMTVDEAENAPRSRQKWVDLERSQLASRAMGDGKTIINI
jgi:hypothetical protein